MYACPRKEKQIRVPKLQGGRDDQQMGAKSQKHTREVDLSNFYKTI
jgi:hypothetical protein